MKLQIVELTAEGMCNRKDMEYSEEGLVRFKKGDLMVTPDGGSYMNDILDEALSKKTNKKGSWFK